MPNTTLELVDEIKEVKGISSDYGVATLLDVLPQTISHWRKHRTQMGDSAAVRAARMLGRAPGPILATLAAERAKDPEVAKVWRESVKALARKGRR